VLNESIESPELDPEKQLCNNMKIAIDDIELLLQEIDKSTLDAGIVAEYKHAVSYVESLLNRVSKDNPNHDEAQLSALFANTVQVEMRRRWTAASSPSARALPQEVNNFEPFQHSVCLIAEQTIEIVNALNELSTEDSLAFRDSHSYSQKQIFDLFVNYETMSYDELDAAVKSANAILDRYVTDAMQYIAKHQTTIAAVASKQFKNSNELLSTTFVFPGTTTTKSTQKRLQCPDCPASGNALVDYIATILNGDGPATGWCKSGKHVEIVSFLGWAQKCCCR